ncbi:MAG: tetratricopeptide repeat protein [Myxococcota bacterium]|nr:tetratricopeptide repeat protein [Myxococcota bacterium]
MASKKDKILADAQKLAERGQPAKAARELRKVTAEDPTDAKLWQRLGELEEQAGQRDAAIEAFQRSAELYSERGSYLQAVALYRNKLLPLAPELLSAHVHLAELYQHMGLVDDALEEYLGLAVFYEEQGRRTESKEILRRVLLLKPDHLPAQLKLAELHITDQEHDKAADELGRVCEQLLAAGRPDDYVKVAERLVYLRPDDVAHGKELIRLLLTRGQAPRALHHLQRVLQISAEDIEALELLAQTFGDLEQGSKAVQVLHEIARLYDQQGNIADRNEVLREVLRRAPDDPRAKDALGTSNPDLLPPAAGSRSLTPSQSAASLPIVAVSPAQPPPGASPSSPGSGGVAAPPPLGPPPRRSAPLPPAGGASNAAGRPEASSSSRRESTGRFATPVPASPGSREEEVVRLLTETRVYIKYGLKQKALEHVARVLAQDPENLEALVCRKDILLADGDHEAAALVLLRLAELTRGQPELSRAYLAEAQGLGVGLAAGPGPAAVPGPTPAAVAPAPLAPPRAPQAAKLRTVSKQRPRQQPVASRPAEAAPVSDEVITREMEQPAPAARRPEPSQAGGGPGRPVAEAPPRLPVREGRASGPAPLERNPTPRLGAPPAGPPPATRPPGKTPGTASPAEPSRPGVREAGREGTGATSGARSRSASAPGPAPGAEERRPTPRLARSPGPAPDAAGLRLTTPPLQRTAEALSEADFFLAQGLLQDAQQALQEALDRDPGNTALQAKLQALPPLTPPPEPPPLPSLAEFELPPAAAPGLAGAGDAGGAGGAGGEDDEDGETHYDLGIAYLEMGLVQDAIQEFRMAMEADVKRAECHRLIGQCHRQAGNLEEAVDWLKRGLRVAGITRSETLGLLAALGETYLGLGDPTEARRYLERVAREEPAYPNLRNLLRLAGSPLVKGR